MSVLRVDAPWLDAPPTEWQRTRIRNVAQLSPNFSQAKPKPDELCVVVPMESVSEVGDIDTESLQGFETISTGLPLFEQGDVIFAKITPCMENGKGAHIPALPTRYAFGSTEFHVLRPHHPVDGRFLYYYTFNPTFRAYAAENMVGAAGQKRVSSRFLKDTRLFLPSLREQRRIAAFLDRSCKAVDEAITRKREQLALLDGVRETTVERAVTRGLDPKARLAKVGQDWIDSLPAHWQAVRIKRLLSRMDYGISESTERDGSFPVLKMGNIQGGEIRFTNIEFVESVDDELILEADDILYNRTNSADQVGKAAIFRGSKADGVTFASYLVRLRANHRILPAFLNYVVNCSGFLSFARKLAIPSVQQSNLNSTRYGRIFVPAPPRGEQRDICAYLDAQLARLKDIASTIEAQIDTLTAYRKSLIHEYVTGLRRVPVEQEEKAVAYG